MRTLFNVLLFIMIFSCNESDEEVLDDKSITQEEKENVQFLKEEEKLARDVYLYAYDVYQLNLFKNISNSEQSHMNNVDLIMEAYNIQDLSPEVRGDFQNQDLQKMYIELTALVEKSVEDALKVGATIEDLDINDLNYFISNTSRPDINNMYELLRCGSTNHMRAFIGSLETYGEHYVPQFISLDEYENILESPKEKCGN